MNNLPPGLRIFNKAQGVTAPVQDENWYRIKAQGEADQAVIEVYVYGEIGAWGITANQFIQDLKAVDDGTSPVVVAFNTIGGDLFEGLAIHNALRRLGARCTARVDALAASAGSVAACGAHKLVMSSTSMLMIHNPWTWASGDAEDFRKVADVLDQTLEAIIAAYKAKAPDIDEVELRRLVNEETWLTANEAHALGLADEVVAGGVEVKACVGQGGALRSYRNAPQALLALLNQPDPDPDPEPEPEPEQPDSAALAVLITDGCAKAGLMNLASHLIKDSGLKSRADVQAALTRAQGVHDLCVAARMPEMTEQLVTAGLTVEAARTRLFDKLVSGKGGFEIDNSLPIHDEQPPAVKAQPLNPGTIWSRRREALSGKPSAKGATQ